MKNEACEIAVRLKFLDDLISKVNECPGTAEIKDSTHEGKILYNGEEIDVLDASSVQKMEAEIYKQSFRLYYNLVQSEGSGARMKGFQASIRPSTAKFVRRSGGLKEVVVCSLFSAADITVWWEPDVHLAFCELVLHVQVQSISSENASIEYFLMGLCSVSTRQKYLEVAR